MTLNKSKGGGTRANPPEAPTVSNPDSNEYRRRLIIRKRFFNTRLFLFFSLGCGVAGLFLFLSLDPIVRPAGNRVELHTLEFVMLFFLGVLVTGSILLMSLVILGSYLSDRTDPYAAQNEWVKKAFRITLGKQTAATLADFQYEYIRARYSRAIWVAALGIAASVLFVLFNFGASAVPILSGAMIVVSGGGGAFVSLSVIHASYKTRPMTSKAKARDKAARVLTDKYLRNMIPIEALVATIMCGAGFLISFVLLPLWTQIALQLGQHLYSAADAGSLAAIGVNTPATIGIETLKRITSEARQVCLWTIFVSVPVYFIAAELPVFLAFRRISVRRDWLLPAVSILLSGMNALFGWPLFSFMFGLPNDILYRIVVVVVGYYAVRRILGVVANLVLLRSGRRSRATPVPLDASKR